jgi:hypothetical protein
MIKKIMYALSTIFLAVSSNSSQLSIQGNKMLLDGVFINKGTPSEGLLINSRMIQGISDGFNSWPYPDTKSWNATRNTEEFVNNMSTWKSKGLNGFTIGLQGGSPKIKSSGYKNSAFMSDGSLVPAYMNRLKLILNKANDLNMIIIVSLFYRSQVEQFKSYDKVLNAATNFLKWLKFNNYTNIIIEPANECEFSEFLSVGLGCSQNIPNLINLSKSYGFSAGNSLKGGKVPPSSIIEASSVILIHGNSLNSNSEYKTLIDGVKNSNKYNGQPIVINEAGTNSNYLDYCISQGVGWGYYDQGQNNYQDGYQSPPINWDINTSTKKAFLILYQNIYQNK